VEYLKAWLMSPKHINHPYPTEKEKATMVADTGIELKRLNNWFVNNRIRYWKPRMEALQKQNQQNPDASGSPSHQMSTESVSSSSSTEDMTAAPDWFYQVSKIAPEFGNELQSPFLKSIGQSFQLLVHTVSDASTNDSTSSSDEGDASDGSCSGNSTDGLRVEPVVMFHRKASTIKALPKASRKRPCEDEVLLSPRSKFSRTNIDLWKVACVTTPRLNDVSLPTLDEAACLFGYASDQ
jgi:hypothetical protein